jgi:hypothetical protein
VQNRSIVIATITLARSSDEERLLARALARLAATGAPLVIADATPGPSLREKLRELSGVQLMTRQDGGLVGQVRASFEFAAALGRPFILYTEPDKEHFFEHGLEPFIRDAPDGLGAGIVLASRSEEAFRTFPPVQRVAEGALNELCAELIGARGDYSYGPFLMTRELVPHVARLDSKLGWGWRPSTFLAAHRAGFTVNHVTGDYFCPPDQRREDDADRRHRLNQLSQNILGLLA